MKNSPLLLTFLPFAALLVNCQSTIQQPVNSSGGNTTTCTSNCDALPEAPRMGAASLLNSGRINLTWIDSAPGKSTISGYVITPYIAGVAQALLQYPIADTELVGTLRSVSNISGKPKSSYAFTVAASNAFGVGPASSLSNAVTIPDSACTPNCGNTKVCGDNGCGGSCGTCSAGTCNTSGQCQTSGPDCKNDVWNNLEACNWPGLTNSGHTKNITLANMPSNDPKQSLVLSQDNQVIEGAHFPHGVLVIAKNVTIRNSVITTDGLRGTNQTSPIFVAADASLTLEHCTINAGKFVPFGLFYQGTTLVVRNNDFYAADVGPVLLASEKNLSALIENNYFRQLQGVPVSPAGNAQVIGFRGGTNVVIRNNTFDVPYAPPLPKGAALGISTGYGGLIDNITIEGNLIAAGIRSAGTPSVAIAIEDGSPAGGLVRNVRFLNNRFSTRYAPCVGATGIWGLTNVPLNQTTRTGNTVLETGENVDASNPHNGAKLCN